MLRLIFWRLVQLPLILAAVFVVTFLCVWVLPGDPLQAPEGAQPPEAVAEAMRRQYNLHSPWAFATSYLQGVFLGSERHPPPDFGPSLQYRDRRVNDILAAGLPVSVGLGALGLGFALLIGSAAGIIGALRPRSWLDASSLAVALIGISLPNFVVGSILLVLFYALVVAGPLTIDPLVEYNMRRLILPALTLSLAPAAYIARLIRLGLADLMSSDFVRTARAKGLSRTRALFKHALKQAYLPVLSFMGPAAAAVLTGSFIVEHIFNIPGLGQSFVNAVLNRDQTLLLAIVLVFATMLVLFNLLVDIAYAWLDPRIEI